MKVKPSNEIENKNEKKHFYRFFEKYFNIEEGKLKNIKIYSGSNGMFDSEKYFNKNDTPVDSESNNIKD